MILTRRAGQSCAEAGEGESNAAISAATLRGACRAAFPRFVFASEAGRTCGVCSSPLPLVRREPCRKGHIIIAPPCSPLLRQHFVAPPTEALHDRLVSDAEQQGVACRLMPMGTPGGRRDDVAAPPLEPLAIDRGHAFALHRREDIVGCG